MPAAIRFDRVSYAPGGVVVAQNLSFTIQPGARAVLTGPSGGGKSSLLSLVLGFAAPGSGHIEVLGHSVVPGNLKVLRSQLAWVPQEFPVQGSVRAAIQAPLGFRANAALQVKQRNIVELAERLLLDSGVLQRNLEELSGGERRRVAVLMALLLDRPLLVLDEPTAGLDAEAARALRELIFGLSRTTVLAASHDADWVRASTPVIEVGHR